MASISLENQLQSAQNNLLFLQQDHANTLKGLHAEIRRLQQHCTDLTYELMVKSSDPADGGETRCAELHRRCEELEMQLKAKEEENAELMRELEQKTAMISVLENTIKEREKKYLEELKLKSHRLAVLSGELEQRAGTIAYLTAQLHATKKRLLSGGSSEGSPGGSPATSYKPAPPPPREQQPDTPRRRMRKSLSQPLHADYAELCRVGADGRRLALRDALDAMPDPTPFLQARELAAEASLPRERPAVIPPISRERSPAPPDPASPRHGLSQQPRAHVGVAHRIHRSVPPTAAPPELQTLAVDQVNDGKVARKESGTDRTV